MPLVINSLRGGHAHTYIRHAQSQFLETWLRPAHAWFKFFYCFM